MNARPECRECPWTGDYENEFVAPSVQKGLHEMYAGHVVEMIEAPEPHDMCCEPDYDYERGQYVHDERCHGSVLANEEAR